MRSLVLSILLISGTVGNAFADGAQPIPPKPKPIEVIAEPVGGSKVATQSLVPQLSATGVTGGLLAATVVAWMKYNEYATRVARHERNNQQDLPVARSDFKDMETWERRRLVLGGATVVSAGVTAFLWLRYHLKSSVSVQPEPGGGSVSYLRSF